MKLIIGLGNFPSEYDNTKHNVGFMVVDAWLQKNNTFLDKNEFNGWFKKFSNKNGESFIIAKPYTYMNLSGQFVQQITNFFKINHNDILIIADDLDTDLGNVRIRLSGSSGGHNGIKNIIELLGTENIKRIRIGISKPNDKNQVINYVLKKFTNDELTKLKPCIEIATNVIDDFVNGVKFDKIMNKYNH
ncbi:MAG: aminoacyl-tRNA hydrolase [Mycoplasma sp.]|nr:aminoacyl-tRNA hydrolase [Mycoplasma sp.]